jgi:hypothetical protein
MGCETNRKSRGVATRRKLSNLVSEIMRDPSVPPEEWGSSHCRMTIAADKQLPVFESREWVPKVCKDEGVVADDIDGLGSLWVLRNAPFSVRITNYAWSNDSIGRFILGYYKCNSIALMWPSARVLELGYAGHDTMEFFDTIASSDFDHWAEDNIKHCPLGEGGAIWVPYGYSVALVTFPPDGTTEVLDDDAGACSWALTMNLISPKLLKAVDTADIALIMRTDPPRSMIG